MNIVRRTHNQLELTLVGTRLVRALGGRWNRSGGMCLCPAHDDSKPSLSVRIGHSSLLFKCFAGCDTVDVLRALRHLDLFDGHDMPPCQHEPAIVRRQAPPLARRVAEIWNASSPVAGSPADHYLAARGIRVGSAALRYHRRTPLGSGSALTFRPAMIAAVENPDGLVAIQRIFLDPERPGLAADLENPKRALGSPGTGSVILSPATTRLGLA